MIGVAQGVSGRGEMMIVECTIAAAVDVDAVGRVGLYVGWDWPTGQIVV